MIITARNDILLCLLLISLRNKGVAARIWIMRTPVFFAYANRVIYLIFNEKKQTPLLTYQLLMEMVGWLG